MPNIINIRRTLHMACLMGVVAITPAMAMDHIKTNVPDAQIVGEGRLSVMIWDVYDAALFAPQGQWQREKPFALQLSYLRDIPGQKIADRSVAEMRKLGMSDEKKLAQWHTQMKNIFPDVADDTVLTGVYTKNNETIFYKNSDEIGRITDPQFGLYFFDIWLGEQTSVPTLRAQLLGQQK